jgi:hypothetical protein
MKAKAAAMTETMQWTPIDPNKTSNANDRLITQASPHMMATYQVYENDGGKSYAAIMWDGTSLLRVRSRQPQGANNQERKTRL